MNLDFEIPLPLLKNLPKETNQMNQIYSNITWNLITGQITAIIEYRGMLILAELKLSRN